MITGIDHIDMAVSDVDGCSKVFQKMGFEVVRHTHHHGGTAEIQLPGPNQPILDLHPAIAEHAGGAVGVIHIAFRVDNAQETYDEFKGRGIVFGKVRGPHFAEGTGRTLFNWANPNMSAAEAREGLGLYLQFVGPERKPATR